MLLLCCKLAAKALCPLCFPGIQTLITDDDDDDDSHFFLCRIYLSSLHLLVILTTEMADELGLSLTLGFGLTSRPSFQPTHFNRPLNLLRNSSWNESFQFSDRNADSRPYIRGIDVNRIPTGVDGEEENGVSSPNSTISSISGKRSEREAVGDEAEAEAEGASCSRGSDDEDGGDAARKKLRLSKEQSMVLEETFKEHNTLNPKQKLALAKQLNLTPRQVEVWFQNRRARTKLKQTEVDCEYLKRCCENLTEENRRLQKEVQELRALKLSPQLYMHMNPPTTLTMCPQCERVAVSSSSSTSAAPTRHPSAAGVQRSSMAINPWAMLPIQR